MNKPMFFCIGAQKAGTTTLNDILLQNLAVCLPREKETHFFSLPDNNKGGSAAYFKTCFDPNHLKTCLQIGEVGPNYCYFEEAARHIRKQIGRTQSFETCLSFDMRDDQQCDIKRWYSEAVIEKIPFLLTDSNKRSGSRAL